jgi:hypothetical protein
MIGSGGDPDVSARAAGQGKSYTPATRDRWRASAGTSAEGGAAGSSAGRETAGKWRKAGI